jgi:ubiquinone/menaquinone biosynthesis C-methylase UbiE
MDAELPNLPFTDLSFDLALCSHFLFLYSTQLGEAFHRSAIREMCRVIGDVRIFPLLGLGSTPSPWVQPIIEEFTADGFSVSIEDVPVRVSARRQSDDADSNDGGGRLRSRLDRSIASSPSDDESRQAHVHKRHRLRSGR